MTGLFKPKRVRCFLVDETIVREIRIIGQLKNYRDSGGLTKLYLSVPERDQKKALTLLSKVPEVGLLVARVNKKVSLIKKAVKLEMKYDSIRIG